MYYGSIKFENVIVDYVGFLSFIDGGFGIGYWFEEWGFCDISEVVYVVLEQLCGCGLDVCSDFFVVGFVFYEMVIGCLFFDGSLFVECIEMQSEMMLMLLKIFCMVMFEGLNLLCCVVLKVELDSVIRLWMSC